MQRAREIKLTFRIEYRPGYSEDTVYFIMEFIAQFGGIYMDSDIMSIKPFLDPFENALIAEEVDLSNALLKFGKGHGILAQTCSNLVSLRKVCQIELEKKATLQ